MVFSRYALGTATRVDTEFDSWRTTVAAPDGELTLLAVHPFPPTVVAQWHDDLAAVRAAAAGADLVVGDLNATLDHRPLQRLEDDGFRDAAELTNAGWQPTWPANGEYHLAGVPLPPLVAIDHVLVGPRLTARSLVRHPRRPSTPLRTGRPTTDRPRWWADGCAACENPRRPPRRSSYPRSHAARTGHHDAGPLRRRPVLTRPLSPRSPAPGRSAVSGTGSGHLASRRIP